MILFGELPIANMVLIAGLLLVSGILLWRSNRHFARQPQRRMFSDELNSRDREKPSLRSLPPAADHWEVEMHEVARDLLGRIDTKIGLLQQFTVEADRAAARLEKALAASRQGATPSAPVALKPVDAAAPPSDEGVGQRRPNVRHEEIYTLSDYGYPPEEIAQRTGMPLGEVELILSLRGRRT
jgi:hypothetical protein